VASDARFDSLAGGFLANVRSSPAAPALETGGELWSYAELWGRAGRVTAQLLALAGDEPLVAVLASRGLEAYAAILGIAAAGRGYVPLNPKFPRERLAIMLAASGCRTLVVGADCGALAREVVAGSPHPPSLVALDDALPPAPPPLDPSVSPEATAYLLFTSGSTGQPKGVPISNANVGAYLRYATSRYDVRPGDRCSQTFDLTFDLSVHDLFVCWAAGATLCPVPDRQLMLPAQFLKQQRLTAWFSVPSVAAALARARLLKPASFPSLRLALFCGEPLPATLAADFQAAAPGAILENLYGPTETTIAITRYRWSAADSPSACVHGIVPIGEMFDEHACVVVSDAGTPVGVGEPGELCLSGPQVARGYWNDPERSALSFTPIEGRAGVFYRTGDRVRQDAKGCLYYLGRRDHQVKIGGFRVELQEVEAALRLGAGTDQAVAVPWPIGDTNPSSLVAALGGASVASDARVLEACRARLPAYMVPRQIFRFPELALNANGKLDRRAVAQRLQAERPVAAAPDEGRKA